MANKNVNILLKLTDKFTGPLKLSTKEIKNARAEVTRANNMISRWHKNSVASFAKAAKAASVSSAAIGGLAIKTGLTEALDLEGYKIQLETATKDTQKASEIMQYAINLANKTPFEGGELVEGAAKFEAMGLSAKKWLTYAGDMAAATNKSFDQSVEALIDAQTGELERLKEFGITKAMILEQGEKMFAGVQIANNNGQIVNQEKFNEAMLALMEDKFSGGMEKQATTIRGMFSTVTGVTKNALANILGMQNDGTVKAGSLLDSLREKVKFFADTLTRWQQDGTIDAISAKFSAAFGKISSVVDWVIKHFDTLSKVAVVGLGVWGGSSVITGVVNRFKKLSDTIGVLKKGFLAFKELGGLSVVLAPLRSAITAITTGAKALFGVLAANPIMAVIAVITAFVAAVIYAYNHSEKFRNFVNKLWETVKNAFSRIKDAAVTLKDAFVGAFQKIKEKVKPVIDWIQEKIDKIKSAFDTVKGVLSSLGFGVNSGTSYSVGQKATGTPYFKGGLTRINEGGRGEIVNLPNGTKIIPHDVSRKAVGGSSVVVNLTVQGNVISNRAFMEQTGDYIVRKIIAAQGVV